MHRDHTPYWLARWLDGLAAWHAEHYRFVHCESVGEGTRLTHGRHVNFSGPGIHLGRHVHLYAMPDASIQISTWALGNLNPRIVIDDYCIVNPGVRLVAAEAIEIGPGSQLATGAYVTDADWHGLHHRVYPPGETAPVILEENCWVADRATVLKGVRVGRNSIVAAGAVATRDVPPNTVVAGNPARIVKEIDPDLPGTTRRDLFETLDYVAFERHARRDQLAANGLLRWLRTLVFPRRGD